MKQEYLEMLRQRRGMEEDDASQDEAIMAMSSRSKLRECVAWTLGDGEWADVIIDMAIDFCLVRKIDDDSMFYELCDTSDDEMYFTLGMFRTIDEIKIQIAVHDSSGDRMSEYAGEYEELTVVEHKFGWTKIRKEVMTIKRESIFDELIDDYVWKTTSPEQK